MLNAVPGIKFCAVHWLAQDGFDRVPGMGAGQGKGNGGAGFRGLNDDLGDAESRVVPFSTRVQFALFILHTSQTVPRGVRFAGHLRKPQPGSAARAFRLPSILWICHPEASTSAWGRESRNRA